MIKFVNKKSWKEREKFFSSIEGIDFTREEQINFTYEKYIVEIINQVKGNYVDEQEIKAILKSYRIIALITEENLEGMNFKEYAESKMKSQIEWCSDDNIHNYFQNIDFWCEILISYNNNVGLDRVDPQELE